MLFGLPLGRPGGLIGTPSNTLLDSVKSKTLVGGWECWGGSRTDPTPDILVVVVRVVVVAVRGTQIVLIIVVGPAATNPSLMINPPFLAENNLGKDQLP